MSGTAGGTHAVVVGGSMAGLLGARVLADYFDRVTLVERDTFPQGPVFRAGVPQSRHIHVLLVKGLQLLEQYFPGFRADLIDAGAITVRWPADVLWLSPVGWGRRFAEGLEFLSASRELFEWTVRRRLQALPNVQLLDGHEVTDLVSTDGADGAKSVAGIRLRQRGSGEAPLGESVPLDADLVLDASGRNSHAPRWLQALGYEAPPEEVINARLAYASRYYVRPDDRAADWKAIFISARPEEPRTGTLFPIEGNRWIVTLAAFGGEAPPADEDGFLGFARTLRSPVVYQAIKDAQPLSPVRGYQRTENHWRHYESLSRWPERFLITGDAACAFNPVYGQGMTAAALAAHALDTCCRAQRQEHPDGDLRGLADRFRQAVAKTSGTIWVLATGEDLRYPTTEGAHASLLIRLFHRYVDRMIEVATERPYVSHAFLEVLHLLRPPAILFRPSVLLPTLLGRRQPSLTAPPPRLAPL